MDELSLSTNEFKALSSKTRTNILKILKERNYTLSELAVKTQMAAPTVKQHTSILLETGLIELRDTGRKWKYYSLTKKGNQLIESKSKQTNIFIILSSTIIVALLGMMLFSTMNLAPTATSDSYAEIIPYPQELIKGTGERTELTYNNIESEDAVLGHIDSDETTPQISEAMQNCIAKDPINKEKCEKAKTKEECEKVAVDFNFKENCEWK